MTTSQKKLLGVVTVILLSVAACVCIYTVLEPFLAFLALILVSIPGAQTIAAPQSFSNAEIVYVGGKGLGFMNADGSGQETFPFRAEGRSVLDESREIYILTGDRQTLIPIEIFYGGGIYDGEIYAAQPGELAVVCGWTGVPQPGLDPSYIWMGTEQGQERYRLADCGSGGPPERVIPGAPGILSPDEQYSVKPEYSWSDEEGSTYSLILHEVQTGESRVIGEGTFPAWSRDGQWLAYTGRDGIYVVQTGLWEEPRRVVMIESAGAEFPVYDRGQYPPAVSWSPDGRWLVYHVYSNPVLAEDYSIVKVNVETGETTTLVDDAMFPYWVWPADEP